MSTPIVLLPGILGSRLYFRNPKLFWDPDSNSRMLRWMPIAPFRSDEDNRVDLHASEPAGVVFDTANVSDDQMNRGWSTVSFDYYGKLLNQLQGQFKPTGNTYAIGYDWRQDITWLADYVAAKLDQILADAGATDAVIVTHSMGGLVVRTALRDPVFAAKVKAVIHVAMPAAGAVVLYRRLFTGMLAPFDGGNGISDRLFRMLLGNTRKAFVGTASGMPGAIQLIPTAAFPADGNGAFWNPFVTLPTDIAPAIYANAACPPGLVPNNIQLKPEVVADLQDRVADLALFQNIYGDPADKLHAETWLVYGTALDTESKIGFNNGNPNPSRDKSGDGTVPAASATSLQLGSRMIAVPGAEHGGACKFPAVMQKVGDLIRQYLP